MGVVSDIAKNYPGEIKSLDKFEVTSMSNPSGTRGTFLSKLNAKGVIFSGDVQDNSQGELQKEKSESSKKTDHKPERSSKLNKSKTRSKPRSELTERDRRDNSGKKEHQNNGNSKKSTDSSSKRRVTRENSLVFVTAARNHNGIPDDYI